MRVLKAIALTATALTSLSAVPVFAQAPQAPQAADDSSGGDIIVTARRTEEKLQDVPISITVFNQEQLANRNIINSTDLAAYTPSLAVDSKFGPEKASFVIRGFHQDLNTQPTVAVYFADVVAPHLSSNITSGNGAGVGALFDLQNIQVLKGPQGTLFGRNTTGGAILLVPQKPTDKLEGYVEGSAGNYNLWRVQAVLNVPLSDTLKIRLGVDRYKRDGYINNRSGIGPRDFNDSNYWSARLSVLANITPDLENYTILTYAKSDTHGTLNKVGYCNRGTVAGSLGSAAITRGALCAQLDSETAQGFGFYDAENSLPNPFVKQRQWQVINTTTWKASDNLTVKNIISYAEAKERYSFNLAGDFTGFPFVTVYPGAVNPQGQQRSFTEELQFQGNIGEKLKWQAGGYMERSSPLGGGQEQITQVFANCTNPYTLQCTPLKIFGGRFSAGSVSNARNTYFYKNYGIYAQATYKFTDKFSITGGIRNNWDYERENSENIQALLNVNGTVTYRCSRALPFPDIGSALLTSGDCVRNNFAPNDKNTPSALNPNPISTSRPTWLIDIDYKPTPDILIYAKYSRGYRSGGINEANVGSESWRPEWLDNYEVGLKSSWRGGDVRGTFNIDGFWNEFHDQQATVNLAQCVVASRPTCTLPAPTGINAIQNIGRSQIKGIEVDASLTYGNVKLDIGYSYLDAKVTGGSAIICDNSRYECALAGFLTTGSTLPYAPKNRVTLTGTYILPIPETMGRLSLSATFTHTDRQVTSVGSVAAFAQGAIPYDGGISPPTDLLNLNVNWNHVGNSPIDVGFFASNVTDQKYFVGIGGGLSSIGADNLVLGSPRMFGFRLKYHFGD
jgi:iron complex outermembrane receptor protein